ncbi:lipopolysaccharide heptosyltransferase RfaC [Rodentibacter pneumotropicus]|uniref:Lipopolysaccharide heptosyltransferase 1 n=2 Tax=Rodentibacter pneumotropicus TaxID=758 RepID=A0A4S2P896_9PAST|nr:lipopolysaccharide heptosyltransferase RfaC [Rodentibacter pneumotropicus]TGZ99083.1 lipopolysaccharide heptosyltransferase RfaC [Rodentibacter pneumotropicus]THA00594.1 lipopolysaccharide heptosyltransferase RfaC [Rodentibacter pneumotropicus]THA06669.1 lipopolysaccharide heptosyltransferase RfaC [Rodentibacter pneumotropicus]THA14090.1 lipopolysaccharide heptosyltransferase RfaC [Rodentibacter pneumotropicus]
MKICLVKTSSMGDIIHTLPALTDALSVLPNLQVDWVVEENFSEIPKWHSAVNRVIPIALRRWRKFPFSVKNRNEWKIYRTLLQKERYDAVIDAQGLFKSAFFTTRLVNGTKHGYDCHSIREPIATFFYDKKYAISYHQHAVERIRQLFSLSLNYGLPSSQGDYGIAQHFTTASIEPYVIFFHSTTRDEKHWLEQEWKNLIEKMTALSVQIRLPWGNEKEKARAERLAQDKANVVVLPRLSLTDLAQQIAASQAVVSVDTGLAHLTAALDKPNITLYGATDPKLIGCYGKNQQYLFASNMAEISADQVFSMLESRLNCCQ